VRSSVLSPAGADRNNARGEDLEHSDLLLTTAEVSIAFAGFASLVTLLGRRGSDQALLLDVARLRGMILTSLLALAFSLFPFLPYALGAPPESVWRVSSAALFLATGAFVWAQLMYLKRTGQSRTGSLYVNIPLGLLALTLLALNSVLGLGRFSAGVYLFALFTLLFVSGFLFLLAFLSFLHGRDQ
jgi:hypothetical protein